MEKSKEIPAIKNEEEKPAFRAQNDSTEYIDWDRTETRLMPNHQAKHKKDG